MTIHTLGRRQFLVGSGGVTLALPFLPSLAHRTAAQSAPIPKRLVICSTPQGLHMDFWRPRRNSGGDPAVGTAVGTEELVLPMILNPLDPFRQRMTVLTGLDNAAGHNDPNRADAHSPFCCLFTGKFSVPDHRYTGGAAITIDNEIGRRLKAAHNGAHAAMHIGSNSPHKTISYTGPGERATSYDSPEDILRGYFEALTLPDDPQRAAAQAKRNRREQSVLDAVRGSLKQAQSRASSRDRQVLDAYATRIQDRLDVYESTTSCQDVQSMTFGAPDQIERRFEDRLHLLALGLTCNATQVGTITWPDAIEGFLTDSNGNLIEMSQAPGVSMNNWHNDVVHASFNPNLATNEAHMALVKDWLNHVNRWYSKQVRVLLQELDSIPEADGQSLLDHSVVVYLNEFSNTHNVRNLPVTVFGGAGGALRTGQWVNCADGTPLNRLFLTLLRAFGYDDEVFGEPEYCVDGPISEMLTNG